MTEPQRTDRKAGGSAVEDKQFANDKNNWNDP